jgi:hypothetical protein
MELFPAADEEQWNFIKRVIDDCDYYLLIIGGRYGTVTAEGISFTEKEYDYAVERGLKVIALIHGAPEQIPSGKTERDPEALAKLSKFRDKVATGRLVRFWTQLGELPGLVALSLNKTIKTYPAVGWVRANSIANTEALSELNDLRKRNAELEVQIAQLQKQVETRTLFAGRTFEELAALLSNERVAFQAEGKSVDNDLLNATNNIAPFLATGVTNAGDESSAEYRLFLHVARPLALYGLADFLPVPPSASWQRLGLNDTGKRFVSELRTRRAQAKLADASGNPSFMTDKQPALASQAPSGTATQTPKEGESQAAPKQPAARAALKPPPRK